MSAPPIPCIGFLIWVTRNQRKNPLLFRMERSLYMCNSKRILVFWVLLIYGEKRVTREKRHQTLTWRPCTPTPAGQAHSRGLDEMATSRNPFTFNLQAKGGPWPSSHMALWEASASQVSMTNQNRVQVWLHRRSRSRGPDVPPYSAWMGASWGRGWQSEGVPLRVVIKGHRWEP